MHTLPEKINLFAYHLERLNEVRESLTALGVECRCWGAGVEGVLPMSTIKKDYKKINELSVSVFILEGEREQLFQLWAYSLFFPGINICSGYPCQEMYNWAIQSSKVESLDSHSFKVAESIYDEMNFLNHFYVNPQQAHSYLWLNAVDAYIDQPVKTFMTKRIFEHYRDRKIDLVRERFIRRSKELEEE